MKTNQIKVKGMMDADSARTLLDDLVKSFSEGMVCIESGEEFISLKPSDHIDVEIEAAQKKGKEKLVIEMGWRQPLSEKEAGTALRISSKEPELADDEEEAPDAETSPQTTAEDRQAQKIEVSWSGGKAEMGIDA